MHLLFDHDVPDEAAVQVRRLGYVVTLLRDVLPRETPDDEVLRFAHRHEWLLVTCNRDDFLGLAAAQQHCGLIILIRRPTRTREAAQLAALLERAGTSGLRDNINFA